MVMLRYSHISRQFSAEPDSFPRKFAMSIPFYLNRVSSYIKGKGRLTQSNSAEKQFLIA
jgi:hypothetical protein